MKPPYNNSHRQYKTGITVASDRINEHDKCKFISLLNSVFHLILEKKLTCPSYGPFHHKMLYHTSKPHKQYKKCASDLKCYFLVK